MKGKALFICMGLFVLLYSAAAFARPWGDCDKSASISSEQQKFFAETQNLRREMHSKRFDLMELYRSSNPDKAAIEALEKEINDLKTKIQAKADEVGFSPGCGNCQSEQAGNCGSSSCNKHAMMRGCKTCQQ